MTLVGTGVRAGGGSGPPRAAWLQVPDASRAVSCGHLHLPGGGRLDETARRLSHEELAVARLLLREGHDVRALPESRRGGRRPDLLVCGTTVEVKSFAPEEERRRAPTPNSVFNKLVDASGQSPHAVLFAEGSRMPESVARRGVARYVGDPRSPTPLSSIRILGDGYDLAWSRRRSLELRAGVPAPAVGRTAGLGLGI